MKTIHSFILALALISFSITASAFSYTNKWPEVSSVKWELKENRLFIQWNADSDEAGIFYIIEKSTDGKQYVQAGVVLGGFNHHNQYEFAFRINHEAGIHYRVRQVNNNGEYRLLDTKAF